MDSDILIVGGGPAGLSFARSLAGTGLSAVLIERQEEAALADPAYDGREIALTHHSAALMKELGIWQLLPQEEIAPLREARVLNGGSPLALRFDPGEKTAGPLGWMVSNHLIRRASFEAISGQDGLEVLAATQVNDARAGQAGAEVTLGDGRRLTARLLVAADSRFSAIRQKLGIGAEMNALGKAMLVCRVEHQREHEGVATEWFAKKQTIAMLPLTGHSSSAVLTLPIPEAERLATLDEEQLGRELSARYEWRLGAMRVTSSRHVYPLVTTFANRFAVPGAALIGDTAVGMHPVTAHGFNLGVKSAAELGRAIRGAVRRGEDWASEALLEDYATAHRRASLPLYRATNMIVRLYNDERPGALLARNALIRVGRRLPFVGSSVRSMLLQA